MIKLVFSALLLVAGLAGTRAADLTVEFVEVAAAERSVPLQHTAIATPDGVPTGGTSLRQLLRAVEAHAPQVIQAQAAAEAAAARQLAAAAPFDTVLDARYDGRMSGFYGGQVADVQARRRLQGLNATVYGGYMISRGSLPVYEDEYLTNSGGEVRLGARVALLRGRETDAQRVALANAERATQSAEQQARLRILDITGAAMAAYVDWLYAENARLVYDELYTIALVRDAALEKAIGAGQLASITRDENRQLLLARESQKVRAQQRAMEAAAVLALYLRDQNGNPLAPAFGKSAFLPQQNPYHVTSAEEMRLRTLEARPDFLSLSFELDQLRASERLAENDRQPDLDLRYEVRRDFGDGSPTRAGTDHKVGLNLSVPVDFSNARGREREMTAKIKSLRAQRRLLADQVGLALQANEAAITATEQQLAIGASEVEIALVLQAAEEARYLAGASDIFRLNAQESALANSKLRVLNAQRDHDMLLVEFYRVTGELWF